MPIIDYWKGVVDFCEKTELGYAIGVRGVSDAVHYFFSETPIEIGTKLEVKTHWKLEDKIVTELIKV